MPRTDQTSRYVASNRWMHWIIFGLVLLAYLFINVFDIFPKGSALRANLLGGHFLAGLTVLILVGPRLWLRLRNGRPPIAPRPPPWSDWVSKFTHVALYAFLMIQPILGLLTLQVSGKAVALFGVTVLPSLLTQPNRALGHQLEDIHGTIGTIFYYVIALHILAALWHHFGRQDNTLQRML